MKNKCITPLVYNGIQIIDEGDIVSTTLDGSLYNITKGVHLGKPLPEDKIKMVLEPITDDYSGKAIDSITDVDRFKEITDRMRNIFKRKNHDYGNSFEQSLNEEGLAASRIRMGDKWNRFKTLSKGESIQVFDESLRDTLIDLANYSIMTILWLDKQK